MQIKNDYKSIWSLTYPIIIGSLAQSINQLIDSIFLGRVSDTYLGASNIAGLYFFIIIFNIMGFARGGQIIMSRRSGEKDDINLGKTFNQLIMTTVLISAFIFIFLFFTTNYFFRIFIKDNAIYDAAILYMKYRIFAIPAFGIIFSFNAFFTSIGKTKIISTATILMAFVNIFLDYTLINGYYGFPKLGIAGAAIATTIADFVIVFIYILFFIFNKYKTTYNLFVFNKIDFTIIKKIAFLSFPIIIQNFLGLGGWMYFFLSIEKMGNDAINASSILKNLYTFAGIPVWGFASTSNTIISNLIGQGKSNEVFKALYKVIVLSVIFTLCLVIPLTLFSDFFISLFTKNTELIILSKQSFYLLMFCLLLFSVSMVTVQGLVGTGASKEAAFIEFVTIIFYCLYTYICVFIFKTSLAIVWGVEVIYWILMFIMAFFYLRSNHWKKYKI